jgi:hypothetical protein
MVAPDAISIDSTSLTVDEILFQMLAVVGKVLEPDKS